MLIKSNEITPEMEQIITDRENQPPQFCIEDVLNQLVAQATGGFIVIDEICLSVGFIKALMNKGFDEYKGQNMRI